MACNAVGQMPAHIAVICGDSLRMTMRHFVLFCTRPDIPYDVALDLPGMSPELARAWHDAPQSGLSPRGVKSA